MSNTSRDKKPAGKRKRRFPIGFSQFAALAFCVLIGAWMYSGEVIVGGSDHDKAPPLAEQQQQAADDPKAEKARLFRVKVSRFAAVRRNEVVRLRARTEAEADVEIRAETAGRVKSIGGSKGRLVRAGEELCRLDEGSRKAMLAGARAQLAQTKTDYQAGKKLARRGFSAEINVSTKRAAYETAIAGLEQAELDLANTVIKAPFTGIVEEQPAKVGDYLSVGAICAKLVKLDPLLVVGDVSERDISKLKVGQSGRASLVTGESVDGKVRFLAHSADETTRTFRLEMQVANRDRKMRAGVTADIEIPLAPTSGHLLSPALFTLNDEGQVGVRTVTPDNLVRFMPVSILDQGKDGAWVAGLPGEIDIITTGQDYVKDGETVDAVRDEPTRSGSDKQALKGATPDERS